MRKIAMILCCLVLLAGCSSKAQSEVEIMQTSESVTTTIVATPKSTTIPYETQVPVTVPVTEMQPETLPPVTSPAESLAKPQRQMSASKSVKSTPATVTTTPQATTTKPSPATTSAAPRATTTSAEPKVTTTATEKPVTTTSTVPPQTTATTTITTTKPVETTKPFDVEYWVQFAKDYAVSKGFTLDSSVTGSWDTPMTVNNRSKYTQRDIEGMLDWYHEDGYEYVWVWAELQDPGEYLLFIGYG